MVVGGGVADGHRPRRRTAARWTTGIADATAPYLDLAGQLAPKSAAYAALPATGTAEVTDTAITLTGDGVSGQQVFTLDGAALGRREPARSLAAAARRAARTPPWSSTSPAPTSTSTSTPC